MGQQSLPLGVIPSLLVSLLPAFTWLSHLLVLYFYRCSRPGSRVSRAHLRRSCNARAASHTPVPVPKPALALLAVPSSKERKSMESEGSCERQRACGSVGADEGRAVAQAAAITEP